MAQGIAILPQNGFPLANALKLTSEIQQYDKVLKLRDDIVAGSHPRIKLNAFASANQSINQVVENDGVHTNGTAPNSLMTSNGLPGLHTSSTAPQDLDSTQRSKVRLERQRIERDILESFKKERESKGQRGYEQDILPHFDVSEVFFQAQETIKPLTQPSNRRHASSDEETFYSSGAGTDESRERNTLQATTRPCRFFFEDGTCKKGDQCNFSHDTAFKQKLQKPAITSNKGPARPGFTAQGGRIRESPTYENAEDGELADEAPYSPSMHIAVEDLSQSRVNSRAAHLQGSTNFIPSNSSRTDNRQQGRYPQRGKDTQIIRNHITSPIAPTPSRVSPLAVAKVSRIDKGRSDHARAANQHAESISQHGPKSRKRRRDTDANDYARNTARRTTMASPEPYIKPEPVSPPPLSFIPQQQTPRQSGLVHNSARHDGHPLYETISDNGNDRVAPRAIPTPPGHRRVISGPGLAPDPRRQQDLRRIVSTRNLERPSSPGYEGRSRPRTSSQFVLSREEVQPVLSYRASMQPQRQVYLVDDHPMSPPVKYARRMEEPELVPMPPPPAGRVVVDEYGNRYLETTMSDRRDVMVPETRYVEEVRRRPEHVEAVRASVRPEVQYLEQRTYQPQPLQPARASVRPEPRYFEERPRQLESLHRASVRPEARYYEEPLNQREPTVLPRASVRPEARSEAMLSNPTLEQFNIAGPRDRNDSGRPQHDSGYQQRPQSPKPQPRLLDYRASAQPTARPAYDPEPARQIQQDHQQQFNTRPMVRRPEEYGRMVENISRMSVRPVEVDDRTTYRQSVDPERYRFQEQRREPSGYALARQDPYGRQEFIDPPPAARTTYRYVSTAGELPPTGRPYNGHVYID